MDNEKRRTCAVITKLGRELHDEGYTACARMINNSYPEQVDGKGILFLTGGDLNSLENMLGLMKKTPDMYIVLSQENGLRLLPSGKNDLKGYIPVFEEAIEEGIFRTTWELFDAFVKEMEKYRPSAG